MTDKYLSERRAKMFGIAPEPEKKPIKKISIRSVKRIVENKLYLKKRKEYLTEHPKCEVKGCIHFSEQLHHKKGRVGKLLYDEKFFLAVCQVHHRLITDDSDWAIKQGYSISKFKKEIT